MSDTPTATEPDDVAGPAGPRDRLRRIEDRIEIGDLIDHYCRSLDAGSFTPEWARSLFTDDVELRFPVGGHDGLTGMDGFTAEFMRRWARTHHHAANYRIVQAGDRAEVAWSIIATHVHPVGPPEAVAVDPFRLGGYFSGGVRRTPAGWRFSRLTLRVLWVTGSPAAAVPPPVLG